jgi:hypothetical protein
MLLCIVVVSETGPLTIPLLDLLKMNEIRTATTKMTTVTVIRAIVIKGCKGSTPREFFLRTILVILLALVLDWSFIVVITKLGWSGSCGLNIRTEKSSLPA